MHDLLKSARHRASVGALYSSAATAVIAGLVLVGWTFDLEALKRIVPGLVSMNPMTAVAFLLAALSLRLFSAQKRLLGISPGALGRLCAGCVLGVGAARLIAIVWGFDLGVDQWLFPSKLSIDQTFPNRMAPNTALGFLLIGCALLLLYARNRRVNAWACVFALVCGFQSLLAVLGYAYGISAFLKVGAFIPMAVHTAVTFLVVVYGIFSCQAHRGFLAVITGQNAGGAMARRLLPAVILVPAVLGWFRLEGQRRGYYDHEFGVALYTVTSMVVFGWLVSSNALSLFRTDLGRTKAERNLRRSRAELERRVAERTEELSIVNTSLEKARHELEDRVRERTAKLAEAVRANELIMEHSLDVICTVDAEGRFSTMSAACEKLWGYRPDELIGRQYISLVSPEDHAATNVVAAGVLAGEPVSDFENRYLHKNGSLIPVTWSAFWSDAEKSMFAVARDSTERKRIEHALESARDIADRANRAKSEFLSRMSHELRTPMNAILGFAQVMEMQNPPAHQRVPLEHILKGGRHLLDLINEVLDIAKIEAGRMTISMEPVPLREVIEECVALIHPLAAQRSIRLDIAFPADCERHVLADRQRLKQALLNLLSNAVKFNRDGGSVKLWCEEGALPDPDSSNGSGHPRLWLHVADTGYGIPEAELPRLFQPFERLAADRQGIEGTGLGLALTKRLVEYMGAAIRVESNVNRGTIFSIDFQAAKSPVPAAPPSLPDAPAPALAPTGAHTLLYIEDNLSNLQLIEHVLAHRPGIKLLPAMQGSLGLDIAREHRPRLILLDLNLPDIPGREVLRRLRGEQATRDIPVVIISADATPGEIERMLAAGADDYLTKPLDLPKFLAVIDRHLAGTAARQTSPAN